MGIKNSGRGMAGTETGPPAVCWPKWRSVPEAVADANAVAVPDPWGVTPILPEVSKVEFTINGDVQLNQIDPKMDVPNGVGHININKGSTVLNGYSAVPQQYIPVLTGLLLEDKIKMVELYGHPLKRRQAIIVSIEFATMLRSDDE